METNVFPANQVFDVTVRPPRRLLVPSLALVAIVIALVTQSVARTYGNRRVTVTDRRSDEIVGDFREGLLVDDQSPVGRMLTDYSDMSAEAFERAWLDSQNNRLRI